MDTLNAGPDSGARRCLCIEWFVVRGSWFVVRGSWFVVRGSWFVVRGSKFEIIPP